MKITPLLLPVVSLALLLAPTRADEAAPVTLTPEVQALLAELLKAADAAQPAPEAAPTLDPAPVATEAKPAREARPPLGSASSLRTGRLTTSALTGARLAPASSLAGHGMARLSASAWRQLFPGR